LFEDLHVCFFGSLEGLPHRPAEISERLESLHELAADAAHRT